MKAYEIPVSIPVLKMLRRDYGYSKHMRIDKFSFGKLLGNRRVWESYLSTTRENQVRITLVCPYIRPAKLYTIARMMESEFNRKMMLYVEGAVESGMDAAEAIRTFTEKYDLSEEDLPMPTAYKRWQRYQNKELEKDLLPLW